MKKNYVILLLIAVCAGVLAESRVWTGRDGSHIKGTYNRTLLGKIQIRDDNNKLHLIPVQALSKRDRRYIRQHIIPEMELDFKKKSKMKNLMDWTIDQDRTTLYTCTVTVEKKSPLPSDAKLTAELYIIAEEVDGNNYILVQYDTSEFVFPEGRKSCHEWIVEDIPIRKYYNGWAKQAATFRGGEYLGYVIAVQDDKGNLITYKTDLQTETWFKNDLPGNIKKLRALAIQGRASAFSRHFDETIQKSALPRPGWHFRTSGP